MVILWFRHKQNIWKIKKAEKQEKETSPTWSSSFSQPVASQIHFTCCMILVFMKANVSMLFWMWLFNEVSVFCESVQMGRGRHSLRTSQRHTRSFSDSGSG